ncbi:MAG: hypothetical protein WCG87_10225 [Bacteroidota bacterium]
MKKILLILSLCIFIVACTRDKKEMLVNRWKATHIENPQLDQMMKEQADFIDTLGKNNDPVTNERLYGVKNIDSMRKSLKMQLDTTRMIQDKMMQKTTFDFKSNNLAILNFGQGLDSAIWSLDNSGILILDEKPLKNSGGMVKMEILELSDTSLKLKYTEKGIATTATFHPEHK